MIEINSLIASRRSGKAKPDSCLHRQVTQPELFPCDVSSTEPEEILRAGKLLAKKFLNGNPGDQLGFARSFCKSVICAYWFALQEKYSHPWPPPRFEEASVLPAGPADSLATTMREAAARLDPVMASYLIGVTYTSLIPPETRSKLGVFYTPPALTRRLVDMATCAGVDWTSCRVVDPACGGGAFLAPVAARMVAAQPGLPPSEVIRAVGSRLKGFEIDSFAAWASQVSLEVALMDASRKAGERLPRVVEVCNSLLRENPAGEAYDLVIGNPPYGRVTLRPEVRERYKRSLYGHANLYGLFSDLAVQLCRPGGVIAYVTPASFLAGEYFKRLRSLLAKHGSPANIDFVIARKGVFEDALQETLLATYRKSSHPGRSSVHFICPVDQENLKVELAGSFELPLASGNPWLIPRTPQQENLVAVLQQMSHRLRDYGYEVSTGPLVWNRHKNQLTSRRSDGTLPLIWAEAVTSDGHFVFRAQKKNHQPYFKPLDGDDWLILRKPCVL
ncbi:MAG: Eco57I restriction-modification methylase domain-containing protein, partial [Acidobacteria bacterium]|nr:Eco57I restriction-modification methylase domain-containing protein [Acidobacteriota bacterium]